MSSGSPIAIDSEFEIPMNKNICYQGTESDTCSSIGSSHSAQGTSGGGDSTAAAHCESQHTNSKVLVALKTSGVTFPTAASSKGMASSLYNNITIIMISR